MPYKRHIHVLIVRLTNSQEKLHAERMAIERMWDQDILKESLSIEWHRATNQWYHDPLHYDLELSMAPIHTERMVLVERLRYWEIGRLLFQYWRIRLLSEQNLNDECLRANMSIIMRQGRGSEATEAVFCLQAKKPLHSGSYELRVPKKQNKTFFCMCDSTS